MGIIRAVISSADSVLKEQWLEFFSCGSLDSETLIRRGVKRIGARSANSRRDDNIITNGSVLAVADGQCVIVTSQGKVIDVCDEPGEHRFYDENHPGGVGGFARDVACRVGFGGGDVQPIRHRIYYVNTKECMGVRFDSSSPVPIAVRDEAIGADLDLGAMIGGVFSYRVKDPVALYRNVVGNIEYRYQRTQLNGFLSRMVLGAIPEALAKLIKDGIRPHQLPLFTPALRSEVTERLKEPFLTRCGLEIVSLAFDTLIVSDIRVLSSTQFAAINRDPAMAAAAMTDAVGQLAKNLGH